MHSAGINAYLHTHEFLRPAARTQRKQKQALSCRTFFIILAPHRRDRESFFRCAPTQRMGFSSEMRAHRQWDYFSLSCVHAHISLKAFSHLGISAWLYCFRQVPGSPWKNIRGCSGNVQRMWLTRVRANREILGRLLKCSLMGWGNLGWVC